MILQALTLLLPLLPATPQESGAADLPRVLLLGDSISMGYHAFVKEALRDEERRWLFLRAGGSAGMVVLQEDRGSWPAQHLAFRTDVDAAGLETAAERIEQANEARQGHGLPDYPYLEPHNIPRSTNV